MLSDTQYHQVHEDDYTKWCDCPDSRHAVRFQVSYVTLIDSLVGDIKHLTSLVKVTSGLLKGDITITEEVARLRKENDELARDNRALRQIANAAKFGEEGTLYD